MRSEVRAGRPEGGRRRRRKQRAGVGSTADWRAGHGKERTQNTQRMSVTLEVSKPSGWLNADAPCRESSGGHTMRGEVRAGGWVVRRAWADRT